MCLELCMQLSLNCELIRESRQVATGFPSLSLLELLEHRSGQIAVCWTLVDTRRQPSWQVPSCLQCFIRDDLFIITTCHEAGPRRSSSSLVVFAIQFLIPSFASIVSLYIPSSPPPRRTKAISTRLDALASPLFDPHTRSLSSRSTHPHAHYSIKKRLDSLARRLACLYTTRRYR